MSKLKNTFRKLRARLKPRPKDSHDEQFRGHYIEWRAKRLAAILNHYGPTFFLGKTLLELGCGHADIGAFFANLGAKVTCTDARPEHLVVVRRRHPGLKTITANLETEWPLGSYDIIIHMGVLYHLKNFTGSLEHACQNCRNLILETEVCDSDDPNFVLQTQEAGFDQAMSGIGSRPSAEAIEKVLRACGMSYERITDDRCNSHIHRYNWPVTNTKTWEHGLRRFWFAEKR